MVKTKAMLQEEIKAKEQELVEMREAAKRYEMYEQLEKGARDVMTAKMAFVNAGFSEKEAFELIKIALKERAASVR